MTIPKFDEFMWRALAPGQPNSIPAMIRNADTLNGYATGVGSAVAHTENEQLHASYAENATAEQRLDLQRQANRAEEVMDRFVRPELQGTRTGPIVPANIQTLPTEAALRLQLELLQADPAARIAEANSKARIAEAEAESAARIAEADGKAKSEEAQAKVEMKKVEWNAKNQQQERKLTHEKEMLDIRSAKRTATGLRSPVPPVSDLKSAVPGVEDQFHPKTDKEFYRVALWNTLEPGPQSQKVRSTATSMVENWREALLLKLVPHHDRYNLTAIKAFSMRHPEAVERQLFELFPNATNKTTRSASSIFHGPQSSTGTFDAVAGIRIRSGAYWPIVIKEASSTNQ